MEALASASGWETMRGVATVWGRPPESLRRPWMLASLRRRVSRLKGFSRMPTLRCENSERKSWKWLGGRPLMSRMAVLAKRRSLTTAVL